jgi:hypothetical protein
MVEMTKVQVEMRTIVKEKKAMNLHKMRSFTYIGNKRQCPWSLSVILMTKVNRERENIRQK